MHASSPTDTSSRSSNQARLSAEAAVAEVYDAAGLTPPRRFVWADSPIALARLWADRIGPGGRNVKSILLDDAIAIAYRRSANAAAGDSGSFEVSGRPPVRPDTVETPESLAAQTIQSGVMQACPALVRETGAGWRRWLRKRRLAGLGARGWTPLDRHVLGLAEGVRLARSRGLAGDVRRLERLARLAALIGWIIPHERVCWLSQPCTMMHTDAAGRAHSANGPAIGFADGWSIHAWKGIVLPDWVIEEPWRLTASVVDHPHSVWVRRCMIEIMTPGRFVAEGGADCFTSDEAGRLWRRRWWNRTDDSWDAWAAVEVVNGTVEPDGSRKRYFLQVPPEVRSAREGVAWTYGLTEQQYLSLERRT